MNIALINKLTNACENIAVFASLDVAEDMFSSIYFVIKAQDGYGIGDMCVDGVWSKQLAPKITPEQQRQEAYSTMLYKEDQTPLIDWQGVPITLDAANQLWIAYSAEGSTKADELTILISAAKEYIRQLYPDSL